MLLFPSGQFYEPADLGFNATPVGAGLNVDGAIVPSIGGLYYILHLNASVAVTSLSVRVTLIRETGQNQLLPANVTVWSSINAADAYLRYYISADTMTSGGGSPGVFTNGLGGIGAGSLFCWPYFQLNVANSSAVSTNVTLRLFMGPLPTPI